MANIIITVPDGIVVAVVAAIKNYYGSETSSLTNRELLIFHLRKTIEPIYSNYLAQTNSKVATARNTLATAETSERMAATRVATARQVVDNALADMVLAASADMNQVV